MDPDTVVTKKLVWVSWVNTSLIVFFNRVTGKLSTHPGGHTTLTLTDAHMQTRTDGHVPTLPAPPYYSSHTHKVSTLK